VFSISNEAIAASIFAILIILWGISVLLFGRVTVKHIEREMLKEGSLAPTWDKGLGIRFASYAHIIIFPNIKRHSSVVNIDAIKRYARRVDFYIALFMECSFIALIIVGVIVNYLYIP